MSDEDLSFAPGWYRAPNDPANERYFDGTKWTDNYRAPQALPQAPGAAGKEQDATGVIVVGYVFAVLMPIVGFIIGLTQINKNRHGIWVVVVAVLAFLLWMAILSSSTGGGGGGGGYNY
jgi:hypothetical protein